MTMTVLNKKLAVVAMSGGVDSSVAALLLKEQGLEVIGVSMKTHEGSGDEESRSQTCCAARDIQDARRVCQQLDIPFYPLNTTLEFQEGVINYFAKEYMEGRTPNPCVQCNDRLKFATLLGRAKQLGAYYLATGHYVQRSRDRNGRYHLLRAKDKEKDQSYFLFGLGQQQLEHLLFPLGRYSKQEVRELARGAGLPTAEKPESQEICFVTSGHYAELIENRFPTTRRERGVIVDRGGRVLGKHEGIHAFTVGQRRGLGVASTDRLFVTEILPQENKVVVGTKDHLMKNGLLVRGVRWVLRDQISSGLEVQTMLRYRHRGTPSFLTLLDEDLVKVEFRSPDGAVTPGQAAVLYRGEELLGGGWIEKGL